MTVPKQCTDRSCCTLLPSIDMLYPGPYHIPNIPIHCVLHGLPRIAGKSDIWLGLTVVRKYKMSISCNALTCYRCVTHLLVAVPVLSEREETSVNSIHIATNVAEQITVIVGFVEVRNKISLRVCIPIKM